MRLAITALVLLTVSALARAEGERAPMEVAVDIPALDAERFAAQLAERVSFPLRLVDSEAARGRRARLEVGFDGEKRSARIAYHDGERDVPALVVVARFGDGEAPGEEWLLAQAVMAIRGFDDCSVSLSGPAEVLNPWSQAPSAGRQRWAEVLDPWLGCAGETTYVPDWPEDAGDFILEGEVLDPWLEAAYDERSVALTAPRPGMPPRQMTPRSE